MALIEVAEPHEPVNLAMKMEGPVFDQGIPVHLLVAGFSEVQAILDKTYLGLINRHRMTREERTKFFIKTNQVTRGSVYADFDLVIAAGQASFAFINAIGPSTVWEYTKQAYDLLQMVFGVMKAGKKPEITVGGNDNSIININTGTQTVVFNAPVLGIAQQALPHYQTLDHLLEASEVKTISFGSVDNPEIKRTQDTRGTFDLPTVVDDAPVQLECEIFNFDKFRNTGKLIVADEQAVIKGEYKFSVVGDQDVADYISAMLRKHVKVSCLREISQDPFAPGRVVRLQLTKVGSKTS
ncbi:MAG: hypothetical protein ABJB97_05400 [Acidobacteriota bacterium]